jgi:Flp pilus assembly pilin Flp
MKAFNYEKCFIFLFDEEATAMAEYALILGLILVTIAAVVTTLGARISAAISKAVTAIPS